MRIQDRSGSRELHVGECDCDRRDNLGSEARAPYRYAGRLRYPETDPSRDGRADSWPPSAAMSAAQPFRECCSHLAWRHCIDLHAVSLLL